MNRMPWARKDMLENPQVEPSQQEEGEAGTAATLTPATRWLLASILLLGAFLRFYKLGSQSLWFDELFSRRVAVARDLGETIRLGSIEDMFPPLFPILSHFAVRLPVSAEVALRLPSAIAGTVCIWMMYRLGRALHSIEVGVIAAGLMACSWFAVSYSQEGRPYAGLLLCSIVIGYLAVGVVKAFERDQPEWPWLLAFAGCGLVASYWQYIGLIFFAMAGAALLVAALRGRAPLRGVVWALTVAFVAYLPWVGVVLAQMGRRVLDKEPPSLREISGTYSQLCNKQLWVCVLLLVCGWLAWRKQRRTSNGGKQLGPTVLMLVLWATVPVLFVWSISHLVVPIYTKRNMIVVLPAILLLVALALHRIDRAFFRKLPVASALTVLALLFDLVVLKSTYSGATKEPYRQLVERVLAEAAHASAPPVVWVQPERHGRYFDQYFELLGSNIRATTPDASGRPAGEPRVFWILTRRVDAEVPAGYSSTELVQHEPDLRIPWPGLSMALTKCERLPVR